jgi:adenylate cyclase
MVIRSRPGDNIAGKVFESGKPLILNKGSEQIANLAPSLKNPDIVAAISFPLIERNRIIGVLNVSEIDIDRRFSQADAEMISVICSQAMMALESIKKIEEKAEKIRLRTLLEQYIDPEVAEVLITSGKNPIELGEVKNITILFADLRGFTHLVQEVQLELLRAFLNQFFGLLTDTVMSHKGILDKFMGDSILAIFGAPIFLKNPTEVAVSAAVEMQEKFQEMLGGWEMRAAHFRDVGLGIGISSGKSFLGNVGYERRLDYTVIGTSVNLAQRMASEAPAGEIFVNKEVAHQLNEKFCLNAQEAYLFKGMEIPIQVFSVK